MCWRRRARDCASATCVATLTSRQRQILDLVLAGHPSKNIAADLGISQRTVDNHEEDRLDVPPGSDPHGDCCRLSYLDRRRCGSGVLAMTANEYFPSLFMPRQVPRLISRNGMPRRNAGARSAIKPTRGGYHLRRLGHRQHGKRVGAVAGCTQRGNEALPQSIVHRAHPMRPATRRQTASDPNARADAKSCP